MLALLRCLPPASPALLADIILAHPELAAAFQRVMRRKDELGEPLFVAGAEEFKSLWRNARQAFVDLLRPTGAPRFGVIIDETQKITDCVERTKLEYFMEGWYGWQQSPGTQFVRMDIASSHGAYGRHGGPAPVHVVGLCDCA